VNLSQQGFIKLHRKIQQHWIYDEKRKFSKFEAWTDMLMMANHKDNKFVLGNELVEVKKGSFITSELKLMDRWDWGKAKLRAFLEMLEKDEMIVKKSDRKKTTISICNYCVYHDYETNNRPQADHEQTDSRPSADTNKNVKNDKEDIYTIFEHWKTKNIVTHKTLSDKMKSHINARLGDYSIQDLLKAIDNYHEVLMNERYYWSHRWTLQDFMKPNNVVRFVDSSKPFETFLSSKPKQEPPRLSIVSQMDPELLRKLRRIDELMDKMNLTDDDKEFKKLEEECNRLRKEVS
jgi:hypothetical protein